MKPLIFCGFHHTGKTTLMERAVSALTVRGYRVGVVKHSSGRIDFGAQGKDPFRIMKAGAVEVHILANDHREGQDAVARREQRLELILDSMHADFALVEGFKGYRGPIPRIVFGRSGREIGRLIDEVTIGYSGFGLGELGIEGVRFLPMDIRSETLAGFIEDRTVRHFVSRDCGQCGFRSCRELLVEVLRGETGTGECVMFAAERGGREDGTHG